MLIALILLRPGFQGRARRWWTAALVIQVWHFCERFLLLLQAIFGWHFLGRPEPTSIAQLFVPRVELHLFYNTVVFVPMAIAMIVRGADEGLRPDHRAARILRARLGQTNIGHLEPQPASPA